MKIKWCVLLLLLVAAPAFAQKKDEPTLGPKGFIDVPAADLKETYKSVAAAMPPAPIITQHQVVDWLCMTNPGNPPTGKIRLYCDSGTGQLTCLSSTGTNVCPSGGGGGGSPAGPAGTIQSTTGTVLSISNLSEPTAGGVVGLKVNEDSGFVGPNPAVYVTAFNARAVNPTITPAAVGLTANCIATQNQVTISSASTLLNSDGLVLYGCGASQSMSTPTAPTVAPAIAMTGTGTGIVSTSVPNGGVTSNYKIIARDKNGGMTAASPAGTTSVGESLGAQTVNITSWTRTNDGITATTASAHGFLPGCSVFTCGEVFLSAANSLTDTSFAGWYPVSSAADNTHFTIATTPFDARNGASASATGGTATWYNANHISWSAVTGSPAAWEYYIYCDRANTGTFTLCGTSRPQGVNTDLTWDDFGPTMMGNFSFPAYVPTSPPSVATSDHLSTTITAGAGTTTLTLASPAGTTVSGTTTRLDACPGFVAAAQAINANGIHGGTLVIPATNGNQFVINSYCDLTPYQIAIDQRGPLYVNDTLATKAKWYGDREPQFGNQSAAGAWQGNSIVSVNTANPGVYNPQQFATLLQGVSFNGLASNGALLALYEGGFNMSFLTDSFSTSTSGSDYVGIGLYLRGSTGQSATNVIVDRTLFSAGGGLASVDGANHTPIFNCNLCGSVRVRSTYYLHRGAVLNAVSSGGSWVVDHSYINGGGSPLYSMTGGSNNLSADMGTIFLDTFAHPCLVMFSPGNQINFPFGQCGPSSNIPPVTGLRTPTVGISTLVGNSNLQNRNTSAFVCQSAAADGIFGAAQTGGYCVNENNAAVATGKNYPIFVNGTAPAAPTGSVSAGGSIAVNGYVFLLVPIWQNGGEGVYSPASSVLTTSSGNQTITLSWANPAVAGNPKGYNLYWCTGSVSSGCAQSTTFSNPQSATSTGITLTAAFDTGAGASGGFVVPAGGPTMLAPGTQGIFSPSFNMTDASGFVSSLKTNSLTANRTPAFPDNSGTVAEINLAQTWTANQFIANGTAIRFFGPNGVNWTALTGPGSNPASNVTFQLPNADSSGVQCISSNGSGVLSFSNCSAGTGTPGGSTKNVQFNNASSFAGASNFNYTAATGVVDLAQLANGNETLTGHRFTDSSPTGNLIHLQNAALNADLFKLDVSGNLTVAGVLSGASLTVTSPVTVANGGSGAATFTANQLLAGNGTSAFQSIAGSTTGTNPVLKLQPASASSTALTLDTAATPTGDILDVNVNGTKTAWFDKSADLNVPAINATGSGPLVLSGNEGTCPSPTIGLDIICLGDVGSHSAWLSNNGVSFKPIVQFTNTAPTAHGVALATPTFPQISTTAAGATGLPLVGQGSSADPIFAVLGVVGGGTGVATLTTHGVLVGEGTSAVAITAAGASNVPLCGQGVTADPSFSCVVNTANGGTGATSLAGASIVTVTGVITANDCVKFSSGTVVTDAGAPCGSTGSVALSAITAATTTNTINNGIQPQEWDWALTGSTIGFKIGEHAAATGSSNTLFDVSTLSASTAAVVQFDNNGNGVSMSSVGVLASIGTGSITANKLNQALNTSAPITGGGTQTSALTIACPTCATTTSGGALSGVAPVALSSGGAISITGAAGQVLAGATPAFTATPALGTDGSVAGTLQISNSAAAFHSILGSVATANNTVNLFATAPVTGDVVDCVTVSTTCTLTDSGVLAANLTTASGTLTSNIPAVGAGSKTLSAGYVGTPGTVSSGHLACYTSSGTVGNCTGLSSIIGVFTGSTTWTSGGETTVVLDATVNVTFGDNLCASPTSVGTAHDNGAVACTTGLGIGTVKTTASGVTTATAFVALR